MNNQCFSKLLITFLISFACTVLSFGQDSPIKFGKIDLAELQMKSYDKDTSAEAVILCDYGTHNYEYHSSQGYKAVFFRHIRIKIFQKPGYNWATFSIPTFTSSDQDSKEYVMGLKGATYNLVDGKVVITKLEKESIFDEKVSKTLTIKKGTLPNVKEGSIIEYTYRIESDFTSEIRPWEFQKSIPTVWSEYQVRVPEYYKFQLIKQGYEPFFVSSISKEPLNLGPRFKNIRATYYRFVQKDVSALKVEPFISTIEDYRSQVEFEIAAYAPEGGMTEYFSLSWNDFSRSLTSYENFGGQLSKTGFLKETIKEIKSAKLDTLSKIYVAYNFVANNMTWNGQTSFLASSNLKKSFESRTGNVADINLMLVALLRELGLDADPVVLSTRDNGHILDYYVLERKFNYVIAAVNVGNNVLLLDATEPLMPLGQLPMRCLNGQGRLIHENTGYWVDLTSKSREVMTTIASFEILEDGKLKGRMSLNYTGYTGHLHRLQLKKDKNEKYIENLKKSHPNWEITSVKFEEVDSLYKPLQVHLVLNINEEVGMAGDRIYLNSMMGEGEEKNPFIAAERKYPVDFGTLIEDSFIATFQIPKGYVVEELPKSIRVNLPENGGKFTFMVGTTEDAITISSKVTFQKTMYFAEEYSLLKSFYNQIVQKHAEKIVLKKAQ